MKRNTLTLADGRRLAWAAFGPSDGHPVLYCHGFPASGTEGAFTESAAVATGARVLAPDRPGFGGSDPLPGRHLADWPADAIALLDAVGTDTAPVIGLSGGGPYALTCAARAPERFPRVATLGALHSLATPGDEAGMAPLSRFSVRLARRRPGAQAALFQLLAVLIRVAPATLFRLLSAGHCPADRAVFDDPEMRTRWTTALREGVARGGSAATTELRLYLEETTDIAGRVRVPVSVWHGLEDTVVPPRHGERIAAALSQVQRHFVPGGGHFSVPVNAIADVLAWLLETSPAQSRGM